MDGRPSEVNITISNIGPLGGKKNNKEEERKKKKLYFFFVGVVIVLYCHSFVLKIVF